MTTTRTAKSQSTDIAIFGRLLSQRAGEMSPDLARYVLGLGFGATDRTRMEDLARRNQESTLSSDEYDELMGFVKAGHLLALLHSTARKALRKRKVS